MNFTTSFLFLLLTGFLGKPVTTNEDTMSIYDFKAQSIDGQTIAFSAYRGKKLLIVNTASECGYTPQYAGLQELHEKYGDKLRIIGFPADNFGGQEPGSNQEIAQFCEKNYGVTFQLFSKVEVVGAQQHPLYKFLKAQTGKEPTWNFCKYLVSEDGSEITFYPSAVKPAELAEKL